MWALPEFTFPQFIAPAGPIHSAGCLPSCSLFFLVFTAAYLHQTLSLNADSESFTMALAHGGRIVPILAGQEQHDSTPQVHSLDSSAMAPKLHQSPLPDQPGNLQARRNKDKHSASLEMSSLKERGLFALPTEGDG